MSRTRHGATPLLLADCGNSTCKLARSDRLPGEPLYHAWHEGRLRDTLSRLGEGCEALVLLPGNAIGAGMLQRAWSGRTRTIGRDLPLPDCGQYPGCGADRVLAGLAAIHERKADCIVVSAGTASTIDLWRHAPQRDSRALFAGGCITAGPDAMLAGLHRRAPALPDLQAAWDEPPFPACDTAGCLQAGARLGARAAVAGLVARLRRDEPDLPVVCTGGWCDQALIGRLAPAEEHPDLVLRGLQLCASHR
ncbi:MAG: type III pantothenate kinase [Planctomycetota bacterium]